MDSLLRQYHDDLKALRRALKAESARLVGRKSLRDRAAQLGKRWSAEIVPELIRRYSFPADALQKYSAASARLIKLSSPNNSKASYLASLESLIKPMRDELILPLQSGALARAPSAFEAFVATLKDPEESAYFQEAVDCAKQGFLRAAAVMGWCAAIDRIHRKIEQLDFARFNVASAQMASQQKGRFKKFNQTQNVNSLSELREVFDTTILWILEGMALIDSNQHTRLRSCFEMRCHCAHPGEAPITEYNLMSYFSDIQQIVLESPTFEL